MERILLYYPTTNIPDGAWVRNSLLYTDKVSSILPYDLRSERVTDLTKLLSDEGLFHPIYISDVLNSYHSEYENFEKAFIATIESDAFQKLRTDSLQYYSENTSDYEMFKNKFTGKLVEYLSDKQLLEDRPWGEVAVEKNAAGIYFGMLVNYLARINSKNLIIPSTDEQEFERLTYQIADEKVLTHRIQLDNCLPALSPNATIKDIVKFKSKRKQELLQFREALDNIESEIKAAGNDQERKLKMVRFAEKVQREILEIKKLLGDSKLDFVLNGLSSLLDFKQKEIVGTISSLGVVSAGIIASVPLIALGAGTVVLAGTLVSSFRKINRQVEANSWSYIYYAQKAGILTE